MGTQPTTYSIIDSNLLNKMVNEGCYNGFGAYVLPGTKLVDLPAELEDALERGDENVFKADTLEELADKLGIDQDTLLATIDRYNEFCANGRTWITAKNLSISMKLKRPLLCLPYQSPQPQFHGWHKSEY